MHVILKFIYMTRRFIVVMLAFLSVKMGFLSMKLKITVLSLSFFNSQWPVHSFYSFYLPKH